MKKNLFIMILLMMAGSFAVAQDHDHAHFPEDTLLALEGQDAISKKTCYLFITDIGYDGAEVPENLYAKVLTNYSHGHDQPEPITVKLSSDKEGVLVGTAANGKDQIAIFIPSANLDLRNAASFNLKWWHVNHYHTNRCVNLQVHED